MRAPGDSACTSAVRPSRVRSNAYSSAHACEMQRARPGPALEPCAVLPGRGRRLASLAPRSPGTPHPAQVLQDQGRSRQPPGSPGAPGAPEARAGVIASRDFEPGPPARLLREAPRPGPAGPPRLTATTPFPSRRLRFLAEPPSPRRCSSPCDHSKAKAGS